MPSYNTELSTSASEPQLTTSTSAPDLLQDQTPNYSPKYLEEDYDETFEEASKSSQFRPVVEERASAVQTKLNKGSNNTSQKYSGKDHLPLYNMDYSTSLAPVHPSNKVTEDDYTLDICLGIKLNLMKFNPNQRFLISAVIVLGMFIPYAWIQEYLMQSNGPTERPQDIGAFLTFCTFICWGLFSFVEGLGEGDWIQPKSPFAQHLLIAALSTVSMSVSNIALQYVNYPTKVLFKTSKTIPVMCTGVVFFKKKYLLAEYLSAICLIFGVVWFSYGNMLVAPSWSIIGYMLMTLGLAADSICQNLNEKTITEYRCSEREMMFYTSTLGASFLLTFLLFNGSLYPCADYFSLFDWSFVFIFAWLSFIGNKVLLTITKANGIFISLFLTSVRKLISILFSFLFFPKPFTYHYVLAGCVAFFGIALNIWVQTQKDKKRRNNVFHHEKSSSI